MAGIFGAVGAGAGADAGTAAVGTDAAAGAADTGAATTAMDTGTVGDAGTAATSTTGGGADMSSMFSGGGGSSPMSGMGGGSMSSIPGIDKLTGLMKSAQNTTNMFSGGPSPTSAEGYMNVLRNIGRPVIQSTLNPNPQNPVTQQQGKDQQNNVGNSLSQIQSLYNTYKNYNQ